MDSSQAPSVDDELTQALEAISRTGLVTHAPVNQHYVKLRCHDEIVQTIVKTIHRDTITEFIDVCQKSNIRPWGDIPIKNVCYLFLYWLVTGKSYRQLHEKSGYPKSNYKQSFGAVRAVTLDWADKNVHVMKRYGGLGQARQDIISRQIVQERKDAARSVILDPTFQGLTLMLDGKIFRLKDGLKNESRNKAWRNESWLAYKLHQQRGTNIQFVCDNHQIFTFISDCFPGSFHDMRCIQECIESLKFNTILTGDKVVADAGYQGLAEYLTCRTIKKKPRGRALTAEEEDVNHDLSAIRSKIERAFGNLLHKFKILDLPGGFDGRPEKFNELLTICVGIWNIDRRRALGITLPPTTDNQQSE